MKQSSLTSFFTKLPQTPTGNSSSITSPDRKGSISTLFMFTFFLENIQNNFQKGEKFRVESNNELNFDESFSSMFLLS